MHFLDFFSFFFVKSLLKADWAATCVWVGVGGGGLQFASSAPPQEVSPEHKAQGAISHIRVLDLSRVLAGTALSALSHDL